MRMQPTRLVCSSRLVGLLALVGCHSTPSSSDTLNVITVLPLSGNFAVNGEAHKAAIQMAIIDLQKGGSILGKQFRAFPVDAGDAVDACKARVQSVVDQLTVAGKPNVVAIISSTATAHACSLPTALSLKIPHFEVSSGQGTTEIGVTGDFSFAFQPRALCMLEATLTGQFIASQPQWRHVALMRGTDEHDVMHTGMIRDALNAALGATATTAMVGADDVVMASGTPYEQYIMQAMAASPAPDAIFFHLRGDNSNQSFIAAAKRVAFPGAIVTCGMARKTQLLNPVDPGIVDYMGGRFYFVMRGPVQSDNLTRFNADYNAFTGKIDTFAPSAYDATMMLGLGIAAAGTTDGATVRDAIRSVSSGGQKVNYGETEQALSLIAQGVDIDYDGASGPVDFRADNSVAGRYYVEQVTFDSASGVGAFVTQTNALHYDNQ